MRELLTSGSAFQREQPLPHDEKDEDDLVKGQDPDTGTNRFENVFECLWAEGTSERLLATVANIL